MKEIDLMGGAAKNRGRTAFWAGTLLSVVVLAAVAMLIWTPWTFTFQKPVVISGETVELAHLTMLGHALRYHADEHDGHYPGSVGDIEWQQAKPGMGANGLPAVASRFHHPETRKVMDWLYYAGHTESDPAETVLVASPVAFGANKDRRMVTRIGNVTEVVAESDFQRQVGPAP